MVTKTPLCIMMASQKHACCVDLQHTRFTAGKALDSCLFSSANRFWHSLCDLMDCCDVSVEFIRGVVHGVADSAQHECYLAWQLVSQKARQGTCLVTKVFWGHVEMSAVHKRYTFAFPWFEVPVSCATSARGKLM
jgi:hypothetical protein